MTRSPFMFSFTPDPAPAFVTWTSVLQYIWKVDDEINALNRDIAAQNERVPADWLSQRDAWWKNWKDYRDRQSEFTTWSTQFPGDMWQNTGYWQAENEIWRKQFVGYGGAPVGPEPQKAPEGPDVIGAVKWGAAAAIAAVAAYGVYRFAGAKK